MPELEHDLEALAPNVDVSAAGRAFSAARRRRRANQWAVRGVGSTAVIAAAIVIGVSVVTGDEPTPVEIDGAGTVPADNDGANSAGGGECGWTIEESPLSIGGVTLTNVGDAPCHVETLSVIGTDESGDPVPIPEAPTEQFQTVGLPLQVEPGEVIRVVLFNQPLRCRLSESRDIVTYEVTIDRTTRLRHTPRSPIPWCGVAHAVVRGGPLPPAESDIAVEAGPGWRFLVMERAAVDIGTLDAATTAAELEELWVRHDLEGTPPDLDLADAAVVAFTIADDVCPPTLEGFEPGDGGVWTPVLQEPGGRCYQPLAPKTFVALVERRLVGDSFTLRLPADEPFSDEQRLLVSIASRSVTEWCETSRGLTAADPFDFFHLLVWAVIVVTNEGDEPCYLAQVIVNAVDSEGTAVIVDESPDQSDPFELPAVLDPGDGFGVVIADSLPSCPARLEPEILSFSVKISDISMNVPLPEPVRWCRLSYSLIPALLGPFDVSDFCGDGPAPNLDRTEDGCTPLLHP